MSLIIEAWKARHLQIFLFLKGNEKEQKNLP